MRKPLPPEAWLQDDQEQLKWTWTQIQPHLSPPLLATGEIDRQAVLQVLKGFLFQRRDPQAFTQLKRRWNTDKFRARQDLKTYSFVLSSMTARRLATLAKGSTRGKVLTDLIDQAHQLKQQSDQTLKEEKARLKAEYEQMLAKTPFLSGPTKLDLMRIRNERDELKEAMKEWESVIDALLRDNIRMKSILGVVELDQEPLNTEQQASADRTFTDAKNNILETIRGKKTLTRIFGRSPLSTTES